jgi:hypothetical protein
VRAASIALALAASCLSGCEILGAVGGAAVGAAAGGATLSSPVAMASALAVEAGIDHATKVAARRGQRAEQDAIAAVAGDMRAGEARPWELKRGVTRRLAHGEVRVTRLIYTPLAVCKELIFSVVEGEGEKEKTSWFTTSACQQGEKWKWAAAEPSAERWGSLH